MNKDHKEDETRTTDKYEEIFNAVLESTESGKFYNCLYYMMFIHFILNRLLISTVNLDYINRKKKKSTRI